MAVQLDIISPVGDVALTEGNSFDDVLTIQFLLNRSGVLRKPLPLDGEPNDDVVRGIVAFQEKNGRAVTGRVDPFDQTWEALNAVALAEFNGVEDRQERRMIIQRPNPEWSFSRGRFRTLTDAGLTPTFHASADDWMPRAMQDRVLTALTFLLDPANKPAPTFGAHAFDWCHIHLGFWSGAEGVPVRPEVLEWRRRINIVREQVSDIRSRFGGDLLRFTGKMFAKMVEATPLLEEYLAFSESVMIHHTFERSPWRPFMDTGDPRRHTMVDRADNVLTPPYRAKADIEEAENRNEFLCESTINLNILVNSTGMIHPLLGIENDLRVFSGFDPTDGPAAPLGPALHS